MSPDLNFISFLLFSAAAGGVEGRKADRPVPVEGRSRAIKDSMKLD
jgi:hypothetical protein